jgi:hypothetical protein
VLPDAGSTIPGFRVAESAAGSRLVLVGEHRLATYALVFSILESEPATGTELLATSYADFHRPPGRVYRVLLLRSGMHQRLLRKFLRHVAAGG